MGLFGAFKNQTGGGSNLSQFGFGQSQQGGLPPLRASGAPSSSRDVGFPDRFQLDSVIPAVTQSPLGRATGFTGFVDDLSQKGVEGFGALFGTLPARVAETPFSVADTALKRGGINLGESPFGTALGVAGESVNRIGNFIPALINARDAAIFKAIGDLPDDTRMTDDLLRQAMGLGGGLFAPSFGESAGGGLFGIGSHVKTVREFKAELAKRRFFQNEDGTPISPEERLAQLRGGKSAYDFGYASVNDSPLVDMATRMLADPTNALFLVPGGAMAKLGLKGAEGLKGIETAGRVLPRVRLVEAGAVAARLPRPIMAAEAIAKGDMSMGTLKGLGELLKGGTQSLGRLSAATVKQAANPLNYIRAEEGATGVAKLVSRGRSFQKSSLALGATNIAINRLTGLVNDSLGGNVPVLSWVNDFTKDVENDRPLSENSAWMLASAVAFPYGEIVGGAAKKVGAEKVRLLGRNEYDDLVRAAGSHEQLLTKLGGDEGLQNLLYFADKQFVRRKLGDDVIKNMVGAESIPDAAMRIKVEEQMLQDLVQQYRVGHKINGKDRIRELKDWAANQGGFEKKSIDFNPTFDDILSRWNQFAPVQQFIGPKLRDYGDVISGLRGGEADLNPVLLTEQVDAALTRLEAAAVNGIVPRDAISRVLSDNPQINSMDRLGYWEKSLLPDAKPVTIRRVRSVLKRQRAESVPIKDHFADVIQGERAAPPNLPDPATVFEPRARKIDRLRAELDQTTDENGTIFPDQVDRAHQIQRELEAQLAEENNIAWVQRAEQEQQVGLDPSLSHKLQAEASAALGAPAEFPATMDAHSPEMKAWMRQLDYEVAQIDPSYTVTYAPTKRVIAALRPDDPDFIQAVDTRTALGDWLHHDGIFSKASAFYDALFGPNRQSDRGRASRQALYNELVPLGAKPKQVDALLGKLGDIVKASEFPILGQRVELYRGIHAVPASKFLEAARESLPERVFNQVGEKGVLQRFDRASSSFYRAAHEGARAGNKFSQVLERFYQGQQNLPGAGARRLIGRTVYPLFRFMLDPRWLLLNSVEAQFLGAGSDGILRANGPISRGAQRMLAEGKKIEDMQVVPDAGWMFGKRYAQYVAKSWEKRSLDTVESALNQIGQQAPELVMLRQAIRREADQQLASGLIDEATHKKQINASNREIGEYINDFLYRTEKRGVKGAVDKTIDEAADEWLTREEREVMAPLLGKVAERNVELWQDVKHMYTGNPDRSTIERVMNSYWLYWPISYQIKATKWLANIMLNGSFGHDNGALLAGKYALWQQEHNKRMKDDPGYAAMFKQNPTLWFMAQMLLPITPDDIGVSLSRATRFAGASAQDAINEWTGSRIGLFTAYKQAQDGVIPALTWITDLGPFYTQDLLNRIGREPAFQALPFINGSNKSSGGVAPLSLPSAPSTLPLQASPGNI